MRLFYFLKQANLKKFFCKSRKNSTIFVQLIYSKDYMKNCTQKLFLALLLCSSVGFAQVKYGVKGGVNIASLPGDYPAVIENKSIIGFHVGFVTDFKLSAKSSFVAEALLSTQGGKTNYIVGAESVEQTINLTNLNIPVLFRYKIIEKLSVEAGPQIGFVVKAKNKIDYKNADDPSQNEIIEFDGLNAGTFVSGGTTYSYEKGIRSVDFSLNLGVTYDLTKNLFLQARYNRGLTAVDLKSTVGESTKSLDIMNSVFQVSVGYHFN